MQAELKRTRSKPNKQYCKRYQQQPGQNREQVITGTKTKARMTPQVNKLKILYWPFNSEVDEEEANCSNLRKKWKQSLICVFYEKPH